MNIFGTPIMSFMKGKILKHTPGMLTCLEFEQYIDKYIAGKLDKGESRLFDRHVKVCRDCRNYINTYERTITQGKAVFEEKNLDEAVPDVVPSGLVDAVKAVKERNSQQ